MKPLRDNQQRAKIAVVFIFIVMFLDAVSAISSFLQYQLLSSLQSGVFVSESQANQNDLRESVIGIIYLIVNLASAVVFIRWFRRAYFNLHLRTNNLRFSEGWAAGSWFVPFMNLYAPYQIMSDLFDKSFSALKLVGKNILVKYPTGLIGLWWTFWILTNLLSTAYSRLSMRATEVSELILVTKLDLAGSLLNIVAGVFVIQLIQRYAKIEPLLNDMTGEIDLIGETVV